MPQSLARVYIHLTYSTAGRRAWLSPAVRPELFAYKAAILKEHESPAVIVGGVEDHVHVLFTLSRNYAIKQIVQEVKTESSKWLKTRGPELSDFQWQGGYAAFSVSASKVATVRRYIENQEAHHQRQTFQDELRALLRKHGVEYDERYLWD
jgi:putative transposase